MVFVVDRNGNVKEEDVICVGLFMVVVKNCFVIYNVEIFEFCFFVCQFGNEVCVVVLCFDDVKLGRIIKVVIDLLSGVILGLLVQMFNLCERIDQGGFVGYVVIVFVVVGMLIGFECLFMLLMIYGVVCGVVKCCKVLKGNFFGWVFMVYEENQYVDVEMFELKFDDVIFKEVLKLECGMNILKVFVVVVLMLGFLGIVVGMIQIFQVIILFGIGDFKLMVGGIL